MNKLKIPCSVKEIISLLNSIVTNFKPMKGATSTTNGASGLVPTPAKGDGNKALCGDGTFKTLPITGGGTGATTDVNARKNLQTNLVTYTNFEQLGLTDEATIIDIIPKIGNGQMFVKFFSDAQATVFGLPTCGMLTVIRDLGNFQCILVNKGGRGGFDKLYITNLRNDYTQPSDLVWEKLAINSKLSMPSSNKISLSLASGDTYTAPADGWLYVNVISPNSDTYCDLIVSNTTTWLTTRQRDNWGIHLRAYVPLAKGQVGKAEFKNGTLDTALFVYAQSEV